MAQGSTYKIVAFTDQSAPGGDSFYHFSPPSIGADGTIAFVGVDDRSEGSISGVYAGVSGKLRRVMSLTDAVPGEPSAVFEDFGPISVSGDGSVGFNAGVTIDQGYVRGIWFETDGGASGAAGKPADFSLAVLGDVAYRSGAVFAKGRILPILHGGLTSEVPIGALLRTVAGVFTAPLTDGLALDDLYIQSIYEDPNAYPQYASSASVGTSMDVNETGKVALKIAVKPSPSPTPPNEAIYAGDPSAPKLIAKEGNPAPGLASAYLSHLSARPSIAADGQVAFSASLSGTPASAIFSGEPGAISPNALEGDLVPTTTDIHFGTLSDAVVNSTGDVIFRAQILYPNEGTRDGIWIQRRTGPPVLLAISGMTLPTPTGDREVEGVDFAGPGTFNDLHEFVFLAKFQNGDEGVYVADTRPGAPEVFVTRPRKPRDFLSTEDSVSVFGVATDDTGIEKVEY
ncbi:MAG: DUF7453 family protein, partial [Chthoniobacterales bacterium]